MKKINEEKCWIDLDNILWRSVGTILLLAGIFATTKIEVNAQTVPCDPSPYLAVTRISAALSTPQTNDNIVISYFTIQRNGGYSYSINVRNINNQFPADTVFKGYLNGVEVGTLSPIFNQQTGQIVSWDFYISMNVPIVSVGDTLAVKKNGQAFLSGVYIREIYDNEEVYGFAANGAPNPYRCSKFSGRASLPTSTSPRVLQIIGGFTNATAPQPITKMSINEPSQQPGIPGAEIFSMPLIPRENIPAGWHSVYTGHSTVTLTPQQYSLLRQGQLSMVVYTASTPNGYSHLPLRINIVNAVGDFEGDGIADLAVFRPSEQKWYVQQSSDNQVQTINFGTVNDKLVVGDYDSDRQADITTFQTDNPNYAGQGVWQIRRSLDNSLRTIQWGLPGDIPLAIDSDGNNTSDLGIFRPLSGTWYIKRMGDIIKPLANNFGGELELTIQWGMNGDKPLVGDFNNDNIDELIVFRPSEGNWYIYNHISREHQIVRWGLSTDIPIAKDFDGDGKVDITVYRPSEGNWYIRSSLDGSIMVRRFGLSEDIPVPADFDKDGVTDIAVFRPSNGTWYVLRSSNNSYFAARFGLNGDIPVGAQK